MESTSTDKFYKINRILSWAFFLGAIALLIIAGTFHYMSSVMAEKVEQLKQLKLSLEEINMYDQKMLDMRAMTYLMIKIIAYAAGGLFLINIAMAAMKRSKKYALNALLIIAIGGTAFVYNKKVFFHMKLKPIEDVNGVQFFYYGYQYDTHIGYQRNPLFIATQSIDYYEAYKENGDGESLTYFNNTIDWLMDHRTIEGDATYYTCDFYLLAYDEQAPWRCGLANSRVILALKLAHEHTQDQKYLDAAQSSLYSFTIPVTEGGLTKKLSDDSWWYCEYPKRNNESPMVLNGMLSILIAMHKYHVYSEDPLAKELFDKGIVALKSKLPEFDNNGNSYYDLRKKPASKDYHKIHISLLNQLYEILPDEMFKSYSDKWQAYANENGF